MIPSHPLRSVLLAVLLSCFSLHSKAIPKAAEHEDAPVTTAADVARPKPSTKTVAPKKAGKKAAHKIGKKSAPKALSQKKKKIRKK